MSLGFYVDVQRCIGCRTCQVACKDRHNLQAAGPRTRRVGSFECGMYPEVGMFHLTVSCNHCDEPACVANCPVQAYTKLENGIVQQNHDLCIGCKTCIEACPYHAPCYDEQESKTYKCDMCTDRQERGELPACVAACPGMNLAVGEMADLEKAHQADIVSDDAVETKPNCVITVDPALSAEPDDTAVEARAAELAASKTAKKA